MASAFGRRSWQRAEVRLSSGEAVDGGHFASHLLLDMLGSGEELLHTVDLHGATGGAEGDEVARGVDRERDDGEVRLDCQQE